MLPSFSRIPAPFNDGARAPMASIPQQRNSASLSAGDGRAYGGDAWSRLQRWGRTRTVVLCGVPSNHRSSGPQTNGWSGAASVGE